MIKSPHTETKFCKESQLLKPVANYARRKGFCLQTAELPFYEFRIDLYGFSAQYDATVAVELKLTDWRRAVQQAMLYQLCADIVYIAMPESSVQRVDRTVLRNSGVGLIAVVGAGNCSCVLEAPAHSEVRQFYRTSQIAYLRKTANA
jgi:hypothetical protein